MLLLRARAEGSAPGSKSFRVEGLGFRVSVYARARARARGAFFF